MTTRVVGQLEVLTGIDHGSCDATLRVGAGKEITLYDVVVSGPLYEASEEMQDGYVLFSGLCAGSYEVRVYHGQECVLEKTVRVPGCARAKLKYELTQPTCSQAGRLQIESYTSPCAKQSGPPVYRLLETGAQASGLGSFNDLVPGEYTLAYLDGCGCYQQEAITVQPVVLDVQVDVQKSCGAFANGQATAIPALSGQYLYQWSHGPTTARVSELAVGTYTVTVTSASQACQAVRTVQVEAGSAVPLSVVVGRKEDICSTSGAVLLLISGGSPDYQVSWTVRNAAQNIILQKPSGHLLVFAGTDGSPNYTVHYDVTDLCGSMLSGDVTIQRKTEPYTIQLLRQLPSRRDKRTGLLEVGITTTSPAVYTWSNGQTGTLLKDLAAGTYTVTVEVNGCSSSQTYTVMSCTGKEPPLDIKLQGGGNSDLTVLINDPPDGYILVPAGYDIRWSLNGQALSQTGPILSVNELNLEEENDQITVTVSSGCQQAQASVPVFGCFASYTTDESIPNLINVEPACTGVPNGSIEIDYQLLGQYVNHPGLIFTINGQSYPLFGGDGSQKLVLDGLRPGTQMLRFQAGSDGCAFTMNVIIPEIALTETYESYNKRRNKCTVEQFCEDQSLGLVTKDPELRNEQNSNSSVLKDFFGACKSPLYCGDVFTGEYEPRRRALKWGYYYWALYNYYLENINRFPYSNAYAVITFFQPDDYCNLFYWCPAKSVSAGTRIQKGGFINFMRGEDFTKVNCGFIDYTVTDQELYDFLKYWTGDSDPQIEPKCKLESYNVGQLLAFYKASLSQFNSRFPGATNSSEFSNLLNTYMDDPRAYLINVVFCPAPFDILFIDELPKGVNRDDVALDHETIFDKKSTSCPVKEVTKIRIKRKEYKNGKLIKEFVEVVKKIFDPIFKDKVKCPNLLVSNLEEDSTFTSYFVNQNCEDQEWGFFAPVTLDGAEDFGSFGKYRTREGGFHYDYELSTPHIINTHTYDEPVFFSLNSDHDNTIILSKFDSLNYNYYSTYDLVETNKILKSDKYLQVLNVTQISDALQITGLFTGNLRYDYDDLGTVTDTTLFVLTQTFSGEIINFSDIHGLRADERSIRATRFNDQLLLSVPFTGSSLVLNGQAYPTHHSHGVMLVKVNDVGEFFPYQEVGSTQSFDWLRMDGGADGTLTWLAYAPSPLTVSGQELNTSTSGVLLVKSDSTSVHWFKQLPRGGLDLDHLDIEPAGENTFLALTYHSPFLNDDNTTLVPAGGTDVLINKFSPSGQLLWSKNYGSSANETISELLYADSLLLIGGTLDGNVQSRIIGQNEFYLTDSCTNSKVYVAALADYDVPGSAVHANELRTEEVEEKLVKPNQAIKVYPNPAAQTVQVEVFDAEFDRVLIRDYFGRTALQSENLPTRRVQLEVSHLSPAMYVLEVYQGNTRLGLQKLLITR